MAALIKSGIKFKRTLESIQRDDKEKPLPVNSSVGRPSKLTPGVIESISKAIAQGHHYKFACAAAGVYCKTFEKWIKTGKEDLERLEKLEQNGTRARLQDITPHAKLCNAIDEALFKAQDGPLKFISKAAKNDWRAAAHFLERRFPRYWGNNADKNNNQPATTVQTVIMVPRRAESVEEWQQAVEVRRADRQKRLADVQQ